MSSSGATNTVTSSSESDSAAGTPTTPSTSTAAGAAVAAIDERASEDALDDVHTRFILNLPPEELASSDRIFFQLEQAYWFYDDMYCDSPEGGSSLRRFSSLRPFAKRMFKMSPVLEPLSGSFEEMWDEFCAYKRRISTYGTIMLNDDCTRLVLCKSFFGEAWTFPAGKVNYGETGVEAGARETYEETGFDPLCRFGLAKTMREEADAAQEKKDLGWSPIRDEDALVYVEENSGKRRTCYVCRGVPEDFPFAPVARKEVSAVEWHDISDLPKKSYAVLPFVGQLKRWIRRNKKGSKGNRQQTPAKKRNENRTPKRDRSNKGGGERSANSTPKRDRSNKRGGGQRKSDSSSSSAKQKQGRDGGGGGTNSRSGSRSGSRGRNRPGSRGRVREGDAVARTLLAEPGDEAGWSEADMFATNEAMLGRKIEYDGNPHEFTGDDGMEIDPHRFRVVGGTLLNSGGTIGSSAPPPETSRLQPLFARSSAAGELGNDSGGGDGGGGGGELEPFFSDGGKAPWETSSSSAAAAPEPQRMERGVLTSTSIQPPGGSNDPGMEILNLLRRSSGASASSSSKPKGVAPSSAGGAARGADGIFLTDAEITARSQLEKTGTIPRSAAAVAIETDEKKENDDLDYMKKWVGGLIRTSPSAATELFGEEEFKFDMGPILTALEGRTMQV